MFPLIILCVPLIFLIYFIVFCFPLVSFDLLVFLVLPLLLLLCSWMVHPFHLCLLVFFVISIFVFLSYPLFSYVVIRCPSMCLVLLCVPFAFFCFLPWMVVVYLFPLVVLLWFPFVLSCTLSPIDYLCFTFEFLQCWTNNNVIQWNIMKYNEIK